jgi:hypothetical protein
MNDDGDPAMVAMAGRATGARGSRTSCMPRAALATQAKRCGPHRDAELGRSGRSSGTPSKHHAEHGKGRGGEGWGEEGGELTMA